MPACLLYTLTDHLSWLFRSDSLLIEKASILAECDSSIVLVEEAMRVVAKEWQNFTLQPLKLYEFLKKVFEQCTKLNSSSNLTSYRWAADAGASYTRWRRNFLKSNCPFYTPPFPSIAFSDLPIIYPQHIPVWSAEVWLH